MKNENKSNMVLDIYGGSRHAYLLWVTTDTHERFQYCRPCFFFFLRLLKSCKNIIKILLFLLQLLQVDVSFRYGSLRPVSFC